LRKRKYSRAAIDIAQENNNPLMILHRLGMVDVSGAVSLLILMQTKRTSRPRLVLEA
jgi:hypothetical protein